MDVEMQLESNGLPKQFESTSNQPPESHLTENLAASVSNSEATLNSLPPKPFVAEPSPQPELPQTAPEAVTDTIPALPPEVTTPAVNGISEHAQPTETSISTTIPDSLPSSTIPDEPTVPLPPPPTATTIILAQEDHPTDSGIPSSIPAESQTLTTPIESTQATMELAKPVADPIQPPISDLRTEPHSDALSADAVAAVEAEKHKLDNAADDPIAPAKLETVEHLVSSEASPLEPVTITPAEPLTATGLPSPPAQSPPPAPRPEPATSPSEKPVEEPTVVSAPLTSEQPTPVAAVSPTPEPVVSAEVAPPQPEEPAAPAPTPAVMTLPNIQLEDQIMTEAPPAVVKQAREREDDGEEQDRAAKRIKTDEPDQKTEEATFKVPDVPAPVSQNSPAPNGVSSSVGTPVDGDDSVTTARLAHMKKVISNLKKSNASSAFRLPVDYVHLNIPNYPDIIKHPMDLSTIDQRLKQNKYTSVSAFVSDFELIVSNCFAFNGPEHGVSQQAKKMQSSFNGQMANLPKASIEDPSKEKKAARKQEPTRQAPPRRPSVSTAVQRPVVANPSPKAAAPATPSFAPGPDGIPLIRRDSSLADGRPKRAIVPTKRNQEFGSGRPKKKKYELQLKFCEEVLKEISHPRHWTINQYFTHPVDPVALNIPTYFQIIRKPMDLGTVKTNLDQNVYEKAKDFEEDVRLIFKNCFKFNPEGDLVNQSGHQLEALFNQKWAAKDEWLASREPPSEPQSEAEDDENAEEESEEEAADDSDEEEAARQQQIALLQKQMEEMSKQMAGLTQKKPKKSKSPSTKKPKAKAGKKEKQGPGAVSSAKDKKDKKKPSKSKADKDRAVTFAEKQYISNGIAMLPEKQMQEALKIIQSSVPSLANSDQNEIELDIEEVPTHALLRLLNFVKKYAGPPPVEIRPEQQDVYNAPAVTKTKKSKPMNKHEQEAQIEELRGKLGAYGGAVSPNAMQSIEGNDSSDDDDGSEESEEE
ncbi:hypothetical protein PV10_01511 [Exophiala mesophila]|uniref:Bromodomain-containing protein n=1 Tax=Exophiala mesophila TaxID=212818 RepID=A0A0D1ZUZ0_EXOME|nr:uncharacterized protein PV10_01511 [Exophiala mesophila]KIV97804.1 hypothetical protein PV10_01511 [Exophiala mesophila]